MKLRIGILAWLTIISIIIVSVFAELYLVGGVKHFYLSGLGLLMFFILVVEILTKSFIDFKFKEDARRRLNLIPNYVALRDSTMELFPISSVCGKKPLRCRLGFARGGPYKTMKKGNGFYDTVKIKSCLLCGTKFVQAKYGNMIVPVKIKEDGTI